MTHFADRLVAALRERDTAFIDAHADSALLDDILPTTGDGSAGMRKTVETMAAAMRRFGAAVLREMAPQTAVAVVRIEQDRRNAKPLVLYRAMGNAGLIYIRVALVRRGDRMMIADWHNLTTGVSVRESLRFLATTVLAVETARETSDRNEGGRGAVPALLAYIRAGDTVGARRVLRRLPRDIAEHPVVVAARIAAARSNGSGESEAVLQWLADRRRRARRYPLLLADYHIARKECRRALRAADDAERIVGREAGIDYLRALAHEACGRSADAYRWYADAIRLDPSFEAPYWRLLDLFVAQRHYADATLVLDILAVKFRYDFDVSEFSRIETYRDFVRSSEFRKWAEEWEQ